MESQQARILELETQQHTITRENLNLKATVSETRAKMERVLKMLYQAFINSSGYKLQVGGKVRKCTVVV